LLLLSLFAEIVDVLDPWRVLVVVFLLAVSLRILLRA
jgi:hypothetical protein